MAQFQLRVCFRIIAMDKKYFIVVFLIVICLAWVALAKTYITCQSFTEFNRANPRFCTGVVGIVDFFYGSN